MVHGILQFSNNLDKCVRILARLVHVSTERSRTAIKEPISVHYMSISGALIDIFSALEVAQADSTKLVSLVLVLRAGCWVTQGYLRHGLPIILGVFELQVLLLQQRPAVLIMQQAHNQNHYGPKGLAWIH